MGLNMAQVNLVQEVTLVPGEGGFKPLTGWLLGEYEGLYKTSEWHFQWLYNSQSLAMACAFVCKFLNLTPTTRAQEHE